MRFFHLLGLLALIGCSTPAVLEKESDPYAWLENIEGQHSLHWVENNNSQTLAKFAKTEQYPQLEKNALELLEAKDKIPLVVERGQFLYNFWQDDLHTRGLLRRTTYSSFKQSRPAWETVLDIDKLAKDEKENWVYQGIDCFAPEFKRCLVSLSRGGKDAKVIREFDTLSKSFVSEGFALPEAKSWVGWFDRDHLLVGTDFGPGSLTESGYPRLQKLWKRGTPLTAAKTLFAGAVSDMGVMGETLVTAEGRISLLQQQISFFANKAWIIGSDGTLTPVTKPDSAEIVGYFKKHLMLKLRQDWPVAGQEFAAGSIIALKETAAQGGALGKSDVFLIYQPNMQSSVLSTSQSQDLFLINVLENVQGKIYGVEFNNETFTNPIPLNIPANTNASISSASPWSQRLFYTYEGFLEPQTLGAYNLATNEKRQLKSLPRKFETQGMVSQQKWATSKDGTKIPYFVVGKVQVINKGQAPTLLYGYGGFEVARTPAYSSTTGKMWLEKGGVYVVANIRGGGEFGPRWHQAALKTNRQRAFDDFIAVAEDLINTKITDQQHLAIMGGSNGGLLVGTVMTQRPDLFKGVVCLVPLLDMARYNQLLAGASWMAEYGDPRIADERNYLLSYSPYHNLRARDAREYPSLFLMTSTKDDRVHPGHARKMAAKMKDLGHDNLYYFENTEGGHAASANLKQRARMTALQFAFLFDTIW